MSRPVVLTHERTTLNYELYSVPLAPGKKWVIYIPKTITNTGNSGFVRLPIKQFETWLGQTRDKKTETQACDGYVARITDDGPTALRGRLVCVEGNCGCHARPPKRRNRVFKNTRNK